MTNKPLIRMTRPPPAIRTRTNKKQIATNLKRIADDLPAFYERRDTRNELRKKFLDRAYAHHHAREYDKLLGHYTELMGPHARAEENKIRAREQAQAHFNRVFKAD